MSENTTAETAEASEQPQVTPADVAAAQHEHMEEPAFRTITSQRQLDTIIAERLKRERAKFADYADLREKAATVDELTTRAEQAEGRLAELEHAEKVRGWRETAAAEYGVPASALRGETQKELTEHAALLSELLHGGATGGAAGNRTVIKTEGEGAGLALNGDPLLDKLKGILGI